MQILLIGNTGQVGWELERSLATVGEVTAVDYPAINLMDAASIQDWVERVSPQLIINSGAYTAVDRAESETETETVFGINAEGPRVLAEAAQGIDAALIHYSTDFVYDGEKTTPYIESDLPNPLSAYGKSKLAGDEAVMKVGGACLILRTSWVYSMRRPSFVTKVLGWARKNQTLRVVTDQTGNPTWARSLAEATAQVVAMSRGDVAWFQEMRGLYHLGGDGGASRFEWAKAILSLDPKKEEQKAEHVLPAKSLDFPVPAMRPTYSVMNCDKFEKAFGLRLPPWQTALKLAMSE